MRQEGSRVRPATPATGTAAVPSRYDFACAYEITTRPGDDRTSEQWARAVWEGAPVPMRWFVLAGWRLVLRLRLGPRESPDHVLGWPIVERRPDETVCRAGSGFLDACNSFRRLDGKLVWSTFVAYDRPVAKVIWPPVSLIHRLIVRASLRRAERQHA